MIRQAHHRWFDRLTTGLFFDPAYRQAGLWRRFVAREGVETIYILLLRDFKMINKHAKKDF